MAYISIGLVCQTCLKRTYYRCRLNFRCSKRYRILWSKEFNKTSSFNEANHYFKVEFKPGLLAGQHVIIEITEQQLKVL